MSVGAWGFGTGAVGTGAHPFCLRIQGIDVIGSVPLDSITVSQSVSGNATLTFSIYDAAGTFPVPQGWADIEFLDTTEEEYIFGGLVMGTTLRLDATPSRWIDVRCVDYGILLDVTPYAESLSFDTWPVDVTAVFCNAAAAAPLGGVTALLWAAGNHGRIIDDDRDAQEFQVSFPGVAGTTTKGSIVRSSLDSFADRVFSWDDITGWSAANAWVWVTPLKQLAVLPSLATFEDAPLEVRVNPTTGSHVAAEEIAADVDHRSYAGGMWMADSDTGDGDQSFLYVGATANGYTVAPISYSIDLEPTSDVSLTGSVLLRKYAASTTGRVTVTSAKNFMIGQALTVYYPAAGLDGTYAIHAVTTRFLGGTTILRRSDIQFGGELGTVARFNRTRFARAGVTT